MAATARKPRAIAPKLDEDEVLDLIDLDAQTDDERGEFERTAPLFRINGVTYEARTTFSAGEAMQYTRIWRERGIDEAVTYAMTQALGKDGWQAFVDYPYLSTENAARIIDQVVTRVNPQAADPKSGKR